MYYQFIFRTANDFLIQLAIENNGRFQKSVQISDNIHLIIHKMITENFNDNYVNNYLFFDLIKLIIFLFKFSHLPNFEGDDLRRLVNEMKKAVSFLKQAITINRIFDTKDVGSDDKEVGPMHFQSTKKQKPHRAREADLID